MILGIGIAGGVGYWYWNYMKKTHSVTMKDTVNDMKNTMTEVKDAAKDKIKDTVNKKL